MKVLLPQMAPHQEASVLSKDARHVPEHRHHGIPAKMNNRVEGHDPSQRTGRKIERAHVAHLKRDRRIPTPRCVDHAGREIDPEDLHPSEAQIFCDMTWSAAEVAYRSLNQFRESIQESLIEGRATEIIGVGFGIEISDSVVITDEIRIPISITFRHVIVRRMVNRLVAHAPGNHRRSWTKGFP